MPVKRGQLAPPANEKLSRLLLVLDPSVIPWLPPPVDDVMHGYPATNEHPFEKIGIRNLHKHENIESSEVFLGYFSDCSSRPVSAHAGDLLPTNLPRPVVWFSGYETHGQSGFGCFPIQDSSLSKAPGFVESGFSRGMGTFMLLDAQISNAFLYHAFLNVCLTPVRRRLSRNRANRPTSNSISRETQIPAQDSRAVGVALAKRGGKWFCRESFTNARVESCSSSLYFPMLVRQVL